MNDRLLTETQRQQKYLDRLPKDFTFPLFNAKQALLSQRASGYRDTASAAREIVDNAIEAGASSIHIVMDQERQGYSKGSAKAIAFIDNGPGMIPEMARYALSWGGGTHFDDPAFIGRFGFGLPNASINQSKSTEVYTKIEGQSGFTKVVLDIDKYSEFGTQTIPPQEENVELPEFVEAYLKRNKLPLNHGTVIVWTNPDRLTYRKVSNLKELLVNDFGVTYRYLLCPEPDENEGVPQGTRHVELVVEGVHVGPVDPLFLLPEGRFFVPEEKGGSKLTFEKSIPVRLVRERESGEQHLQRIYKENLEEQDSNADPNNSSEFEVITYGAIHVRVARFPYQFAAARVLPRDKDKDITDANKRFEIRKPRRGMSFVRAGREIETFDAFPRSSKDKSENLGNWPALHAYAYHWGVEVRFHPELDDVFGITNDKQSVRPVEDFWRILALEGVDDALRAQQSKLQTEAEERRNEKAFQNMGTGSQFSPAEVASRLADIAEGGGSGPHIPQNIRPELNERFEKLVAREAESNNKGVEEVRKIIQEETKRRPYVIEIIDDRRAPFYEPEWNDQTQVVVKLNKQHPFFTELYRGLAELSGGNKVKQVVDVLLIALARAELTSEDVHMQNWYVAQREDRWDKFLKNAIRSLGSAMTDSVQVEPDSNEEGNS